MLTIFTLRETPRLKYITGVLFREILGLDMELTSDREQYLVSGPARINYSPIRIDENEIFIPPVELLFEEGLKKQEIWMVDTPGGDHFFSIGGGDLHFDIFAASFYLLSRYEEYLPHQKDSFGRFDHSQSLAFREGFLDKPLVNIWLEEFRLLLARKFPSLVMPVPVFRFMPTYDIDIAYAYRCRDFRRTFMGAVRSFIQGQPRALTERYQVLTGKKKDPFDIYEWLDVLHLRYRLKPTYFFLLAARQQGFDRNVDPEKKPFQDLVAYHAMGYPVGLHPSWQSGDDKALLALEKEKLEAMTGAPVTKSRQHYIRLSLPGTYRLLIEQGITDDFSMGYGSINGFRASVTSPFSWYDLEAEQQTRLRIHPFCFMDANSLFEQSQTPAQAFEEIRYYHDIVKKVSGTLITIWHNSFFSDEPMYQGWKEVYEIFLNDVVYWDL